MSEIPDHIPEGWLDEVRQVVREEMARTLDVKVKVTGAELYNAMIALARRRRGDDGDATVGSRVA